MSFPYKHVLLVGATSGIGSAMADLFISQDIKVTAVGRRRDRLDAFHPTIDAVFLNAGVQGRFLFNDPSSVDLSAFDKEILVNFTSFVHIVHAVLPHLLAHSTPTALLYTGSHVSLIPAPPMSAYCASKAALESFMTSVRAHLESTNVSLIHISTGPVQTEINDKLMGERGRSFGMPLDVFTKATWEKLQKGEKNIFVGPVGGSSEEQLAEIVDKREAAIDRMIQLLKKFA
ncbi:NAD(P)-binding protein [Periconia macrospinosa]|uniref:NAD(P)-binding protein n=1 Tax=Periconia macrospinosa TaxID=97972 RepID=A0A2V1DQ69_9PLEO|nr:NAD(P)-binding protein [Periconia macrospinosa]